MEQPINIPGCRYLCSANGHVCGKGAIVADEAQPGLENRMANPHLLSRAAANWRRFSARLD